MQESTYFAAAKNEPSARWILAHEVGHLVLQHGKCTAENDADWTWNEVARAEQEANMFAAYFLAPCSLSTIQSHDNDCNKIDDRQTATGAKREIGDAEPAQRSICATRECPTRKGRENQMSKQRGLDGRHRDQNGEIRHKNGNTRVDTLRETYGDNFAKSFRGDMKLDTLLDKTNSTSLSEYLRKD
ncbi:ImmA/IrrE family metallo-endopeptidase [Frankia sp. RB7]|nr:ImmA/IrrE family metallo-endopeptidase [Frankia sp. RB7]